MKFWGALAVAGAVLGGFFLLMALPAAKGAPQEAAAGAVAAALAVVPYVIFRVVERSAAHRKDDERFEELKRLLEKRAES
ncbi:hypothetical protein P3G55_20865 [Leptospira sp. 96542]|nr:hypothetical protein [Leptospira sp. 96542]